MEEDISMAVNTDLFKSFEFVNDIQRKFYEDEEETTLMMGTYGAHAEVAASLLQRALIVSSETANEAIPTKAKYEKNIIAHAKFVGVSDINAVPAYMTVRLYIPKKQVDSNLYQNKFVIDKDCPLMIEEFEFHLDYDIIITRNRIRTNEYVYTAMYDIARVNPLSDLDSPNLPPVGIFTIETGEMLCVPCVIRQIEYDIIPRKITTDNSIENKTIDFEFTNQLATFDVDAVEGDVTYHLNAVYDGTINNTKEKYCEYQFVDTSNIRLKFNKDSYLPRINADLYINVKTTMGSEGNFPYNTDTVTTLASDRFGYSGLTCLIKPVTDSRGGIDRKSVSELKSIIPKEALSRGSIISTTDLDAFFNSTNLENSRLYFYKQKYNQIDHIYYSYLLMKYNNIVVPTNTVSVVVNSNEMNSNGKNWLIKPLTTFVYDGTTARIVDNAEEDDTNQFVYVNPFMIGINKTPLVLSYFLTTFTSQKYLEFSYINQTATLQFVGSSLMIHRSGFSDKDKYKISLEIQQNINSDFGLITKDNTGEITNVGVKVFLLLYSKSDSSVWRYCEGTFKSYSATDFSYTFEISMTTDDTISATNLMKIIDLHQPTTGTIVDSYVENGIAADILIMANTETYYGDGNFSSIIPGIEGYSLCNRYGIRDGLDLFYNYTQMMTSTPIVSKGEGDDYIFTIDKVPMIRKSYLSSETRMSSIVNEIQSRRNYIEYCLNILEDGFDIDFKFFNTYGPSKRFTHEDETFINRVNLSLIFKTKLYSNAEKYLIDIIKSEIKTTIENLGTIDNIHMTNIAESIYTTYKDQLQFFEFVGFNGYDTSMSHIYQLEDSIKQDVPEFLNVNTLGDDTPDIEIIIK